MPKKRDEWVRGYFCAVAMYLKLHFAPGCHDHQADELFNGGGDWHDADPEDIETFKEYGLIPR